MLIGSTKMLRNVRGSVQVSMNLLRSLKWPASVARDGSDGSELLGLVHRAQEIVANCIFLPLFYRFLTNDIWFRRNIIDVDEQ
jgi:hypothetical protein